MPYSASPNSGESLGQTRAQIRSNVDDLKTSLAVNHQDLDLTGVGKHKFVTMLNQDFVPAGAIALEGTYYTKLVSAISEVFYSPDASTDEYQMTRCITASFATFGTNTAYVANHKGGWTFLPGGMLMQYGVRTSPGASGVITFPKTFTNAPYSVVITNYRTSAKSSSVDSGTIPSTSGFKYKLETAGSVGVQWFAIGV